jgi:aerobic carbon-monoxide dehydrogenase medium subunit
VYPVPFDYEVAESTDHAIELLGQYGDEAKLIAGGHSLIPLMRLRLADPAVLVDVDRLDDLRYVRDAGDKLAIGALTRHREVRNDPLVQEHCGILGRTAGLLGDPSVQHRGTLGGTLAHGDPSGDMPSVISALEGEIVVKGPNGERTIAALDFFEDYLMTALDDQEVITEIRVPKLGANTGWAYHKFSRRSQDWAMVGVAAVVERSNGGISSARIGLTSMGSTPIRARAVEQALSGASRDAVEEAASHADEGTSPAGDAAASEEFRRHLSRVITRRAVEEALSR